VIDNQLSACSKQIFRRLGIAQGIRALGLSADYTSDLVSCISVTALRTLFQQW